MTGWRYAAPWVAFALAVTDGCGSSSNGGLGGDNSATPTGDVASGSGSSSGGGSLFEMGGDAGASLPVEIKVEDQFKAPVATGNFVWSANPTSGRVAYINASTFDVQTTAAGDGPTYLAAVTDSANPQADVAIVLNVLSDDATLFRVDPQGNLQTQTYASTADANSWAISPSGHWGIAWTNATFVTNPDPTQSFQFVAVMDLSATVTGTAPAPSTTLAVGFRPEQLAFAGDESRAYAVTEDGISVIQLAGVPTPTVIRSDPFTAQVLTPVPSGGDAGDAGGDDAGDAGDDAGSDGGVLVLDAGTTDTTTPDVSFTPDGAYALIRQDGISSITIDRLSDGTLSTLPLASPPTDLSLSPQGDFAVAVLRDTSTVVILPIPGVLTAPNAVTSLQVPGHTIGRGIVTNGGKSIVLFTTTGVEESLTVVTLQPTPSARTIPLHAPVEAVFPTSDGQYAVVLNQLPPDAGSTAGGAFSVVPIGQNLPAVIESLPAPPTAVAISNDRAIVSTRDDATNTYGLYLVLMPSLDIRPYPLASPPIAVGIAQGASRGYAAQDYSEGRITFVDLGEGDAGGDLSTRTITGFELSAGILVGPDR